MTVLSVVQDACLYLGIEKPDIVFGSPDRTEQELAEMVSDCAMEIVNSHDWQLLTTLATITGDGSTEAWDLPSDYLRMEKGSRIYSSSLETPLTHIIDRDRWLEIDIKSYDFVVNAWCLFGGQINIKPALGSGVTAKYYYVSDKIITDADGSTLVTDFDNDSDVFNISERLLKKCLIWTWKKSKGMAYAEEQIDYEDLKQKLITSDEGSRMIRVGSPKFRGNVKTAYPTTIVP